MISAQRWVSLTNLNTFQQGDLVLSQANQVIVTTFRKSFLTIFQIAFLTCIKCLASLIHSIFGFGWSGQATLKANVCLKRASLLILIMMILIGWVIYWYATQYQLALTLMSISAKVTMNYCHHDQELLDLTRSVKMVKYSFSWCVLAPVTISIQIHLLRLRYSHPSPRVKIVHWKYCHHTAAAAARYSSSDRHLKAGLKFDRI